MSTLQPSQQPIPIIEDNLQYPKSYSEEEESHLLPYFRSLPQASLNSVKKRVDFFLKEQGVTFGTNFNDSSQSNYWQLDIIPHIINQKDIEWLENGIKQRITALNLFLKDVYSNRKILKEKVLPLDVVFGDPNYLRDCVGIKIPMDNYLHLSAIDLARDPDGNFMVVDDNVAIPSGIGYAILNREILRQQYPNLFENRQIRSVWDTTSLMLSRFKECAPRNVENPEVVLLSPGIFNDAYSEHEYLAQKMGIPLVLPKDLVVQENQVYMRTVEGMSRVDIIYRRIQDSYIDPVSFFHDSVLGVPGLLSCVIHGNVSVVNALGSGLASSKALLPFIDNIIRFYLSEEPAISTIETHLLSEPNFVDHVFQSQSDYVIKSIQGTGGYGVTIGPEVSKKAWQELKQKVSQKPLGYVAQKLMPLSHSKFFAEDKLSNRYLETRFYCFRGKTFTMSNAALTRVANRDETLMVCNSQGGASKDTWIMGKRDESKNQRRYQNIDLYSGKIQILSRVAENLFWMGRYLNRVYTTTNVFRVMYSSEVDQLIGSSSPAYNSLLTTMAKLTGSPTREFHQKKLPWQLAFFQYAVANKKNPYSVYSNSNYALNNAREIQNYLPEEIWLSLRKLSERLDNMPTDLKHTDNMETILKWLEGVYHYSHSFYGASQDSFSRQEILQYIQLGRYLEHCNAIISVVKHTIQYLLKEFRNTESSNNLAPFIIILLKILNSYESYQWNYQSHYDPYLAYRMLVIDKNHSNSFVSSLEKIKNILSETHEGKVINQDESPEFICDLIISRSFSFDLRKHLTTSHSDFKKSYEYIYQKSEILPGRWAIGLREGIRILGNKIIDRYSNTDNMTSFTLE